MTVDLRTQLQRLPTPELHTELGERIRASRAAGERIILPSDAAPRWHSMVPRIAAAGIVLLGLSWIAYERWGNRVQEIPSAASFFAGSPFWPTAALSQEIATGDTVGRARYPLLDRVPLHAMQSGSWTYRATLTTDGLVTTEQGQRRFSIEPMTVDGVAAIAIVTHGTGRYAPEGFTDSLIVSRDSLRLLRRYIRYGRDPGRRDFPAVPPRYMTWRDADINWVGSVYRALFQLTPLNDSWRGSVYVPWFTSPIRAQLFPMDLRVIGSERLALPAGIFDTWVVGVGFRNREARVYVDKTQGIVVKTAMPMGEDAVWEQALTGG